MRVSSFVCAASVLAFGLVVITPMPATALRLTTDLHQLAVLNPLLSKLGGMW